MCRRRVRYRTPHSAAGRCAGAVAAAFLALAVAAGTAAAQQTEAELLAHIDSLLPLLEQAEREAAVAEAALEERTRLAALTEGAVDTLRVGRLTVLAPPEDAGKARAAFEKIWSEEFAALGSEAVPRWTFTFHVGERAHPIYVAPGPVGRVEAKAWERRAAVERRVRGAVAAAFADELVGLPIHGWASDNPLFEPDGAAIYRRLVTTPSKAVRSCLAGDTRACSHALGLGVGENPLEVWYTPDERRSLAVSQLSRFYLVNELGSAERFRAALSETEVRCLDQADVDACDALLENRGNGLAPLAGSMRATLVWLALQRGGEGAWRRLVESAERTPAETLAYVSGGPLPELVEAWRTWVVAARPTAHAGLGRTGLVSLLWILFFATLASRSTRWRLG